MWVSRKAIIILPDSYGNFYSLRNYFSRSDLLSALSGLSHSYFNFIFLLSHTYTHTHEDEIPSNVADVQKSNYLSVVDLFLREQDVWFFRRCYPFTTYNRFRVTTTRRRKLLLDVARSWIKMPFVTPSL